MFPENLLQACFQQVETTYENVTKATLNAAGKQEYTLKRKIVFKNGTNVLGLIVFCIAFGVVSGQMGPQADLMVKFFVQVCILKCNVCNERNNSEFTKVLYRATPATL